MGLIKAVEKFDYHKRIQIQYLCNMVDPSGNYKEQLLIRPRTIRIPVHMVETINKLIRVSRQLLQELGREPTPEEIAAKLDYASGTCP